LVIGSQTAYLFWQKEGGLGTIPKSTLVQGDRFGLLKLSVQYHNLSGAELGTPGKKDVPTIIGPASLHRVVITLGKHAAFP